MATKLCSTCNRATLHLGGSCTDHSMIVGGLNGRGDKPSAMVGKVLIPAYQAKDEVRHVPTKIESKPISSGIMYQDDELISRLLGLVPGPKSLSPDKLTCSFCGDSIDDPLRATHGMTKPRKIDGGLIKTYDQAGNVVDFETRIIHVADRKTACPNCVGMLKPLYKRCQTCKGKTPLEIAKCPDCKGTKEGELMHNGIEFPQTEG